jgi:hypothetical protein
VEVGGQSALSFDGTEVLDLESCASPQVLDPSVLQLGEVERVQRSSSVVVRRRIGWDPRPGEIRP